MFLLTKEGSLYVFIEWALDGYAGLQLLNSMIDYMLLLQCDTNHLTYKIFWAMNSCYWEQRYKDGDIITYERFSVSDKILWDTCLHCKTDHLY